MNTYVEDLDPTRFLNHLRAPLTVITYLNHLSIHDDMIATLNQVRAEFGRAETWWVGAGNGAVQVQDRWDQWIRDALTYDAQRVRSFVQSWGDEGLRYWAVRTGEQARQVVEIINRLQSQARTASINLNGLD
ncbi:CAZyme family GH18 [Penicillium herquei]|nr:CAZyme family GH18 [Penicillium herquei]